MHAVYNEPTTGLDPIMADVINNLIVDCVKRLGATTISITHDMVSARKIADRIAMIHKGEIVWQGPARAVDTSGNPYARHVTQGRAGGPIQMEILKAEKEGPHWAALPVRCVNQHLETRISQIRLGASAAIRSSLINAVNSLDIVSTPFDL